MNQNAPKKSVIIQDCGAMLKVTTKGRRIPRTNLITRTPNSKGSARKSRQNDQLRPRIANSTSAKKTRENSGLGRTHYEAIVPVQCRDGAATKLLSSGYGKIVSVPNVKKSTRKHQWLNMFIAASIVSRTRHRSRCLRRLSRFRFGRCWFGF